MFWGDGMDKEQIKMLFEMASETYKEIFGRKPDLNRVTDRVLFLKIVDFLAQVS